MQPNMESSYSEGENPLSSEDQLRADYMREEMQKQFNEWFQKNANKVELAAEKRLEKEKASKQLDLATHPAHEVLSDEFYIKEAEESLAARRLTPEQARKMAELRRLRKLEAMTAKKNEEAYKEQLGRYGKISHITEENVVRPHLVPNPPRFPSHYPYFKFEHDNVQYILKDPVRELLEMTEKISYRSIDLQDSVLLEKALKNLIALAFRYSTAHAIAMFRVGELISGKSRRKPSSHELARELNINRRYLKEASTMATTFGRDIRVFAKYLRVNDIRNWSTAVKEASVKKLRVQMNNIKSSKLTFIQNMLTSYMRNAVNNPEGAVKERALILELRERIRRFFPDALTLSDDNYLPYSDCVCCGETPPKDGHSLSEYLNPEGISMKVPVCLECTKTEKQPNPDKISALYANYARNLDHYATVLSDL